MKKHILLPLLSVLLLVFANPMVGLAQYTGTGTFTKITSLADLTDGYYVITDEDDANAMNNAHTGSLLPRTAVSPVAGVLTDPDVEDVWLIGTDGGSRTIYNEDISKFVSYTGSSNNIQIVNAVTSDNQRWTITYASSRFTATNKAVTNRKLQYNSGAPRFVCYSSTQKQLQFYKMATASGPDAPAAFSATAVSSSQIDLAMTANGNNDNILVAWNSTNTFGTPTDGVTYSFGNTIPAGGGTVLYYGPAAGYNHTLLTASTQYFYSAWSYDGSEYSAALTDDATTPCAALTLPFTEDFEGGTVPPSACWASFRGANSLGTNNDWTTTATTNTGSFAAYVEYENVTGGNAQDWLVTPPITLGSNTEMTFYGADEYATDWGTEYTIRVSTTSQTNHGSFTIVETYTETQMGNTYDQKTVDLSAYDGQTVYIAFVMDQDDGDNWFLDDINIVSVTPTHDITVTQATGGTIAPGTTTVTEGDDQAFTATADACYTFTNWVVDGSGAGSTNPYTFTNVTAAHTLTAVYSAVGPSNITASAGANGSISSSGVTAVNCGDDQSYTITPAACYVVDDVLVDGVSVGAVTNYDFTNVTAPHTISATFVSSASYDIVASAGANGSISPSGTTSVACGADQTYTITPAACYSVADVLVDGVSVGAVTSYTFSNVLAAHTISVTFAINTNNIVATAGANGSISPSGTTSVNCGSSQAYTITPAACYVVADVLVDGVSQGAITSYTFSNVTAPHTISVTFTPDASNDIVATAGANGSISPSGTTSVACGGSQSYTITPSGGYVVDDVLVDGVSVGAVTSYDFTNVTAAHTISATFVSGPCLEEDFTNFNESSYFSGTTTLGSGDWEMTSVFKETGGNTIGGVAARINDDIADANITSPAIDAPQSISFQYRELASGGGTFKVQKSVNNAPFVDVCSQAYSGTSFTPYTCAINESSADVRIRILSDDNAGHLIIDEIEIFCAAPAADVNVTGNGQDIADGQTATGTADHTEFLATEVGQTSTRTFTIENAGGAGTINLLNSPTVVTSSNGVFTITTQPSDLDLDAAESTTFVVTFTPTGVSTETAVISFDNDDPDGEDEYTFTVAGTGTYSQASDIVSNGGETVNIAHSAALVSNALVVGNSVQAGEFTLRDGGGAADNDNQATTLTAISFDIVNSAYLQKVALYDGATELQEVAAAPTVTFNAASLAANLMAADGGSKNFSIRVTLDGTVTDNDHFQFTVASATASATGSGFAAADAGGDNTSIAGNDNHIRVTADRIAFTVEPQDGAVGVAVPSFTVSAVDAYGNIDTDATNGFTLTTSSGTDYTSGSPYTLSGGTLAITDVLYSAIKTSETLTATTTGFTGANNTAVSASFDINEFSAVDGAFLSSVAGGNYNTDATWCECENIGGCSGRTPGSGGWSALGATFDTPGSGDIAYVQGTVTQTGSISIGDMHILDGGMLYTTGSGTYAVSNYLKVYTDGVLWTEKNFTVATGKPFIVEDDAEVYLSYEFNNPSTSIWNGVEDFAPNSHLYIWDWDALEPPLINDDVTTNTYNGYTAAFGNLYIDIAGAGIDDHWVLLGDDYGTRNLCHGNIEFDSPNGYDIRFLATGAIAATVGVQGDFKMNSGWSSARTVALGSGTANITLNLKGDFIMDCPGDFAVRASNSPGRTVVLNIEGDLLMNGSNTTTNTNFELNQNVYGTANGGTATVNLQGNLTVGSDATITNSGAMDDHAFNFAGSTTQLVDVASVVASSGSYGVPMYVKSGATVQLSNNNLVLDESSSLTVENGGTLDFNWAANGTTPLLVTQPASPDGTPAFSVDAGGTIKITSTDANGAIASAGNAFGNVLTTNRTYDAGATYHYTGKANQVSGDGLPTTLTNGKLIVDMNASALTLSLTASTTVGGTGELGLVNGLLVLDDKDITVGSSATVTGTPSANNMVVTNSTGEFVKTFNSTTPFTYPVGDNSGVVEYSPVTLSFTSGGAGDVGVIVTDGDHPNLPTVTNYLSRYWNFTNTLGSYNYNATFTYLAADVNGTLGSIKAARYTGATTVWDAITGSNATGTALTITTAQTQATSPLDQAFTGLESCDPGTWTGADDNNWNNPNNWCSGTLPTTFDDVVIPDVTNQPIVLNATPSLAVCNNLTIEAGADLTINSGQSIIVDGNVTNNGTVYVQNSGNFFQTENGTAAHAGGGDFVVYRQGNSSGGFNGWSTPVVGGTLPGSNGYSYNSLLGTNSNADDNNPDPDPGWQAHSGAMTAGKGYFSVNGNLATFTGAANNGSITPSVTSSGQPLASTTAPTFFNLIGNPYPSAIDADQFISDNSSRIDGALYFWSDENAGSAAYSSDDYATYSTGGSVVPLTAGGSSGVPNGSIPSCQGFFVNCDASGTINFNNGQRGGNNSQFFRMAAPNSQRMWLSINNDDLELFNQTLVAFHEFATDQKDWGVDAYKLRGNQAISIGAQQDGETYVIATYESIPQSGKIVPLMTYVETAGTYTFVADSMEGFENHNVYLEDLSNGSLYPLEQGDSYSFAMTSNDEFGRFQLWYSPVMITGVEEAENTLHMYANNNTVILESTNSESIRGTVHIVDMAGRTVLGDDITITNGIARLQTANLANGIYAVTFVSNNGKLNVSQKVTLGQ